MSTSLRRRLVQAVRNVWNGRITTRSILGEPSRYISKCSRIVSDALVLTIQKLPIPIPSEPVSRFISKSSGGTPRVASN